MLGNKKEKREHLGERNCQGDLWQESYLVSQRKGMMRKVRKELEIMESSKSKRTKNNGNNKREERRN